MRSLKIVLPVIGGLALGYVAGRSSREVVLAPPTAAEAGSSLAALAQPASSEAPIVAHRDEAATAAFVQQPADEPESTALTPPLEGDLHLLDREHRTNTYRRLLRPLVRKEFRDPVELVDNAILNPESRTLTPDELIELERLVDDHRTELLETLVIRNELHDDILEAKLLANDVKIAGDPHDWNGVPTGKVLSMGVLHRDGKSMSYEICAEDHPEFDATYDIELAIKQELEYEVKEFFARVPAR